MNELQQIEERIINSFFYTLSQNSEFEAMVAHAIRNKANSYDLFLLSLKQSISVFGASPLSVNKYRQLSNKYKILKTDYYYKNSPDIVDFLKECVAKSTLFKTAL